MRSPEGFQNPENQEKIKDLESFIETAAAELREKDSVPTTPEGRIDMAAFKDIYPEAEEDADRTEEWRQEWNAREGGAAEGVRDGEKLEMLAYAIFHKNLNKDFVVVRSSLHDDQKNGVDTILLERSTGNLICAFDEVGALSGAEFQKKQDTVFKKNANEKGAHLKYGISLTEDKQIKLGPVEHIPLFYVALPKDQIEKGIQKFEPSADRQSENEKKLFEYFVAILEAQIKGLRLYTVRLGEDVVKKIDTFEEAVRKLKSERGL